MTLGQKYEAPSEDRVTNNGLLIKDTDHNTAWVVVVVVVVVVVGQYLLQVFFFKKPNLCS